MLVVMEMEATAEQIEHVSKIIRDMGLTPEPIPGGTRTAICVLGNKGPVDPSRLIGLPGVKETIRVSRPYKLVSRETHHDNSVFQIGNAVIGDGNLCIIAGPCAVESEGQAMTVAKKVKAAGASIFRAGAFKPRTSPYSFQGLGEQGLDILVRVREETGMPFVTEAVDHEVCALVEEKADIIQIGARNMQNYSLLRRAGKARKPVLLKRGMSATIEEWLMAAEYILMEGNRQVILCERGIRTFSDQTRNTFDLSAIPVLKKLTHLPVVADPSHAAGVSEFVAPLTKGAVAVGADGLMIEVHHDPVNALSDGAQSLTPDEFTKLMEEILPGK